VTTISDVAKASGVSFKTVSRVINGDAPVGAETRSRVEAAIAELGYVPSNAARMMRSNRSGMIGLITGALSQNLEPTEPTGLPDLYIVQGVQQRVEALIYIADYHKQISLDVRKVSQPVVLVNCFDDLGTPSIVPDDERCQFDLVMDLIQSRMMVAVCLMPCVSSWL